MRERRLYSIVWNRQDEEPGEHSCRGLTAERLVGRLIGAIRNSGPITVHAVGVDSRERTDAPLVGCGVIVDLSGLPSRARTVEFRALLSLPVAIWLYEPRGK